MDKPAGHPDYEPSTPEEKAAAEKFKAAKARRASEPETPSRRRRQRRPEPAGGMKIGGITAESNEGNSTKISVREAKEITRRIIERIRKESK